MVHGDDKGLVLPPRVAPLQVICIPIFSSKDNEGDVQRIMSSIDEIQALLSAEGIRCKSDKRVVYTPGWKFNHWEQKGVPIRLEIGPRDLERRSAVLVRRDTGEKIAITIDSIVSSLPQLLERIQADMLQRAREERDSRLGIALSWDDFTRELNNENLVLAPWCQVIACEESVKERTSVKDRTNVKDREQDEEEKEGDPRGLTGAAKSLCIPIQQRPLARGTKCFCCDNDALVWALWGRSY